MSARSPAARRRFAGSPYPNRTTATCSCGARRHERAAELDAELRLLGQPGRPDGLTLTTLAAKYGVIPTVLSIHRSRHLGLPPLPRGRPGIVPPLAPQPVEEMQEARRAPKLVRAEARPLPPTPEGDFAQLVKTVATLITLDAYRGLSTVRALAARHSVSEAEVLRAHRRAVQSVGDARGGLRAQLELSVATLSRIRDEERKVAQDYTGIAERIVAPYLPNAQTGAALARAVPQEDLDRAKTARSIASQAQDTAISAQRQIDQNTIHRRTAPLVTVSFSANPDFSKAHEALVLLLCAVVGPEREESARGAVARGLQLLEDGGSDLDAPEFLEYLAELRADAGALTVDAAE